MVEEVSFPSNEVHVWTLSKSLLVGGIGLVTFLVSFGLLKVYVVPTLAGATSLMYAEDFLVLCVPLLTAIAGYAASRALAIKDSEQFFQSISWRYSNRQVAASVLVGLCATFAMRVLITGGVTGVNIRLRSGGHFVLVLLGVVIAQAFVEEMYFRGILYAGLAHRIGSTWSISVITLIFALGHPQHQWIVLPISIMLAFVRIVTRSTANCFAVHAAYNLGVVLWGIR